MAKRLVTVEDVRNFELVANPSLSPDGQFVLFEKTAVDKKEDEYHTQMWLSDVEGKTLRQLTTSGSKNHGGVWSPDGSEIAFISNRSGTSQVWILPLNGGEARQLTRFRNGVSSLTWSPDGKTLFGLVPSKKDEAVEVLDAELSDKEIKEKVEKENKEWAEGPKRYDWLYYKRDGGGLTRGLTSQIVTLDVATGDYRQLTFGAFDVGQPAVSPDGQYVAFVSNRRENHEVERHSDVYRVPVTGGEMELLCSDIIAYQVAYSPEGDRLAIFGNRDEFGSASHTHLYILPAAGGEAVQVTAQFPDMIGNVVLSDQRADARSQGPVWSSDGRFVFALSTREGTCEVVRIPVDGDGSNVEVIIGGTRDVFGFSCDGETEFAIAYSTATHPSRIVTVSVAGTPTRPRPFRAVTEPMTEEFVPFFPQNETRLEHFADKLVDELNLVEPEAFWYTSAEGWRAQGWVMKPAEFEPGKKCPVILEIHGGPQMMYGTGTFHEMQWFASQGYAVVFTNPRGSMGYGQEFVNAVRHHYGEYDAADVLNGLDAALEKFDFLDGSRVGVTGGSYGGFMTNWLVGHTDRFFAAASQRSISNWFSFYGVSDIGPMFVETQLGGDIFSDAEMLWRMSPLAYAKNVKTPLLLVHSEMDLRCPIEQAEQFYTAIKRFGGEVELFRIPNASHGLSRNGKPKLRIERLNAIFNYINDRLPREIKA